MHFYEDPLAKWRPDWGHKQVDAISRFTGLYLLPKHWHEIVLAFTVYQSIYVASALLSPYLVSSYSQLSKRTKINFNIHVVSMVNCVVLLGLSVPLFQDPVLQEDTLTGSTPFAAFVCSIAVGYFLWDTVVCLRHVSLFGPEFLIHGSFAAFVFAQSLRPYIQYYAPIFLMFEASTPFVNVHWFASHLPKGTIPEFLQVINGLLLIVVFFTARIVWGFYQAYYFGLDTLRNNKRTVLPLWVPLTILTSNMALNCLNVFWFSKMISALKARMAGTDTKAVTETASKTKPKTHHGRKKEKKE